MILSALRVVSNNPHNDLWKSSHFAGLSRPRCSVGVNWRLSGVITRSLWICGKKKKKKSSGKMENKVSHKSCPDCWSSLLNGLLTLSGFSSISLDQCSQSDSFALKANYVTFLLKYIEWLRGTLEIKKKFLNRSQRPYMDPIATCLSRIISPPLCFKHWLSFSSLNASCSLLPFAHVSSGLHPIPMKPSPPCYLVK